MARVEGVHCAACGCCLNAVGKGSPVEASTSAISIVLPWLSCMYGAGFRSGEDVLRCELPG